MIERIAIVCTGRGHHDREHLASFVCTGWGSWLLDEGTGPNRVTPPNRALHNLRRGYFATMRWTPRSHDSWQFHSCPGRLRDGLACGRSPKIDAEKWCECLSEVARVGLSEVDVSLLPF